MNRYDDEKHHARRYRVSVGFASVEVTGSSIGEAIEQARRTLCAQMPRMWDVVQALDWNRFDVRPLS